MKKEMKVVCFYHRADLDGHCSAAIVRKWTELCEWTFVPAGVNYGEEIDWLGLAGPDSLAVIVDFAPEHDTAGTLRAMLGAYGLGVVWIDHHATAIQAAGAVADKDVCGFREIGTAACRLTWRFFFGGRGVAEPLAVSWLADYDVFDRSNAPWWENGVLPFQYGMKMRRTNPGGEEEEGLWGRLLSTEHGESMARHIREKGETCLAFERENNRKTALSAAYDCTFEGMKCCAVNARGNSLVLDAYARPDHKMRILWGFDGKLWRVSLYENGHADVDCGLIAKRYGGGGHAGAAGFSLRHAPTFFSV